MRRKPRHPAWGASVLLTALLTSTLAAHDPRLELPDPKSVPEAWDVLRQCTENVGRLLETNQLKDVAMQVAVCSPQLRLLDARATPDQKPDEFKAQTKALFETGTALILATRDRVEPREKAEREYRSWRQQLDAIASRYRPEVAKAPIYICPMHPADRHLGVNDECTLCGMRLVRRRIPAGGAYEAPGEPTMKLTAKPDRPLEVDRKASVRVTLTKRDGSPVRPPDLLVMHTERIHLLIVDRSLGDYHHEHPTPTDRPGEYAFSFTPRRPGPYRIFADLVPMATGLQEYAIADIEAATSAGTAIERDARTSTVVGGLTYQLSFDTAGAPLRAGAAVTGRVHVTGADGKPFAKLEPVMGAFAHIVGFAEDHKTVVHIHPLGAEPANDAARGGPTLEFKYYPPVAGYTRLYVQVCVDGQWRFAPFGVNVQPAEKVRR